MDGMDYAMIDRMIDESAAPSLPAFTRNQRIVFQHTAGPYPGLFQIGGHTDDFGGQQPPMVLAGFTALGRPDLAASLVTSTPRYVLYREIAPPEAMGTFHEEQR